MASQNHSGSSIDRRTSSANVAIPCSVMNRATLLERRSSASGRQTTEEVLTGRAIYDGDPVACTRADDEAPIAAQPPRRRATRES